MLEAREAYQDYSPLLSALLNEAFQAVGEHVCVSPADGEAGCPSASAGLAGDVLVSFVDPPPTGEA